MKKILSVVLALVALFGTTASAAQLDSAVKTLTITYNIGSSATLTGGGTIIIPSDGTLSNTVTFQATWNVSSGTSARLYTWLSSTSTALVAGSATIPSSAVAITASSPDDAITASACTSTLGLGVAGAGCGRALNIASSGAQTFNVQQNAPRNVSVQLSIPGGVGSYAAGAYVGTLNVLLAIG